MAAEYRIISIGTLAAHPLWDERTDVRTGHTTTTLIETGDRRILVNPSLPATALAARLSERTRVRPESITDVFLTCFLPDHRRALALLEHARWLMHEPEIEAARSTLAARIEEAEGGNDEELAEIYRAEQEILGRCTIAPDRLAPGVDLFPLPGVTPGHCGVLLPQAGQTVLIAGDAVATAEHLEQVKVLPTCTDVETAQESFREAVEIADVIIPGRDNVQLNPARGMLG